MGFYEYIGRRLHFIFGNKALVYRSTEGVPAIKAFEENRDRQKRKWGKGWKLKNKESGGR